MVHISREVVVKERAREGVHGDTDSWGRREGRMSRIPGSSCSQHCRKAWGERCVVVELALEAMSRGM